MVPRTCGTTLPRSIQEQILTKRLRVFVIDGYRVARETGMGGASTRSCRPVSSRSAGSCPARRRSPPSSTPSRRPTASAARPWSRRTSRRWTARWISSTRSGCRSSHERFDRRLAVPAEAPEFVREVAARMIAGAGDRFPVSALPRDGTYPAGPRWRSATSRGDPGVGRGAVHPVRQVRARLRLHAVIRAKVVRPEALADAPIGFKTAPRAGASSRMPCSPCRWPRRTAPAAVSVSRCARPRARARCVTRPST